MKSSIRKFYHSTFWKSKIPIESRDAVLKEIDNLLANTNIHFTYEDPVFDGHSKGLDIFINLNLDEWELYRGRMAQIVMHEFGHIVWKMVQIVRDLNTWELPKMREDVRMDEKDRQYFLDRNELRQRVVALMWGEMNKLRLYDDILDMLDDGEIEKLMKVVV